MFQDEPPLELRKIADAVIQLSDHYIKNPTATTPWEKEFCQLAYRHYYLPLNFQRVRRVIGHGQDVQFFEGLTHFIDWGSGPGTASFAIAQNEKLKAQIKKQILIDRTKKPFQVFTDLHTTLINPQYLDESSLASHYDQGERTCLVFSYSLTELDQLPKGFSRFEALMIIEPSTTDDGRKLMQLRQKLIDEGYSIWAPCTHQLSCPLLTESKRDWCHDRAHVEGPDWFWELDQILPMKNRTITTSYLLARKKKSPSFNANIGRLTGDSMEEKGKTRQLFCRNDKREFLSWMHKNIEPQILPRGELAQLPELIEPVSNELRLKIPCHLLKTL